MALNERQERRLARQRGAGNRELKNADFGFEFASVPLPAKPSSRRTPRPVSSRKKTPTTLQPKRSTRQDRTDNQPSGTVVNSNSQATRTAATVGENVSVAARPRASSSGTNATFQTPVATGKRKRGRPSTFDNGATEASADELERDDERFRPHGTRTPATISAASAQSSARSIFPVIEEADELLGDAEQHQLSGGSRRAVNVKRGQSLRVETAPRQKSIDIDTRVSTTSAKAAGLRNTLHTRHVEPITASAAQPSVDLSLATGGESAEDSVDELSPDHIGGRKSVLVSPPNPQSVGRGRFHTHGHTEKRIRSKAVGPSAQLDEIDLVGDAEEDDDAEDGSFSPYSSSRAKATKPSQKPRTEPSVKPRNTTTTTKPLDASKRGGETIPITIHKPILPESTILEDPLGFDPNPSQNPADVLAQVTSELCLTYMSKFGTGQHSNNPAHRTAYKRQKKALKVFHHALQDNLFNISSIANTGTVLESRLRRNKRELSQLRAELIGIKALRNETFIEKDRVRLEHSRRMKAQEQSRELHDNVQDISYAINLGREKAGSGTIQTAQPEEDFDVLYDSVVNTIGGQGLSGRLRDFNFALSQAAQSLEGKA